MFFNFVVSHFYSCSSSLHITVIFGKIDACREKTHKMRHFHKGMNNFEPNCSMHLRKHTHLFIFGFCSGFNVSEQSQIPELQLVLIY